MDHEKTSRRFVRTCERGKQEGENSIKRFVDKHSNWQNASCQICEGGGMVRGIEEIELTKNETQLLPHPNLQELLKGGRQVRGEQEGVEDGGCDEL